MCSRTVDYVQEQPLLLGALGITVGAGHRLLLPSWRYERRVARHVRGIGDGGAGRRVEAGESACPVAESVIDTAQEATRREGFIDHCGCVSPSAREKVADVAGRARACVEETSRSRPRGGAARVRAGGRRACGRSQRPAIRPGGGGRVASASPAPDHDRQDVLGPGEAARPESRAPAARWIRPRARASRPRSRPVAGGRCSRGSGREATSDRLSMVAPSCAFYAMLALFPAISVLISLYGLLFDPTPLEHQLARYASVLPAAALRSGRPATARSGQTGRRRAELGRGVRRGPALWSAAAGTKALIYALNVAYEEREKRGLIRFNLTALAVHPVRRARRGRLARR